MTEVPFYPSGFPIQPPTNSLLTSNPQLPHSPNLASTTRNTVSVKREDDDVQFVSSNPVKKRKVDHPLAKPTESLPLTSAAGERPALSHLCPGTGTMNLGHQSQIKPSPGLRTDTPNQDVHGNHTQRQQVECGHPELRVSTGTYNLRASATSPVSAYPRGCSVPSPSHKFFQDTFWTAPATRPRSSPALSPKQLPEHISPSVLKLNPSQPFTTHAESLDTTKDLLTSKAPSPQPMDQPEVVAGVKTSSANEQLTSACYAPPGATQEIRSQTDTKRSQHSQNLQAVAPLAIPDSLSCHPDQSLDRQSDGIDTGGVALQSQIPPQRPEMSGANFHVSNSLCTSGEPAQSGSPVNSSNQGPVVREPAPNRPPVPGHQQHRDTRGPCNDGSHLVKSPCRKCLEARLRSQAAALAAGAVPVLNHSIAQPVNSQHAYPSLIPSAWTPPTNTAPFAAHFTGPTAYGSFLHQQLNPGQLGLTSGHYPSHGNSAMAPSMSTVNMGPSLALPVSQMAPNFQQYTSGPNSSRTAAPMSAKRPAPRPSQPQTQSNGKHIIVDIADTCLELFPFDEVAQRHNQPVQKVRDVFNAIIQVPLLRCATDKRRAGKLGTARVREFNQARREMQSSGNVGEGGMGKSTMHSRPPQRQTASLHQQRDQQQQQPSAWEVSQFMGPSDMRLGPYAPSGGPWG
ncbi:hypothetical protein ACRALDRAFT_1081444 [Sodiomyces alcalophilus JCM 7366]|uniref:uncharacterized protein n=1 Tax=Sodiomyces alcalophilus JCM 7366 TaxID=591952 RepID=UPI0039B6CA95